MARVPVVPSLKSSTIEQKAENLIRGYNPRLLSIEEPIPVDRIFELYIPERTGIRTMYTELDKFGITNAEGYTNARQRLSIVDQSLADDFTPTGSRRFRSTVGHETGHCMLHVNLERWQQSLHIVGEGMKRERGDLKPYEDPEWQAWRFCQALCMPAAAVKKMVERYGIGEEGIQALVARFDMNRLFVRARLRSLKLLPADSANYQRGGRDMPRIQNWPDTWQSLERTFKTVQG